jgi:hypothetical protein
MYRQVEPVAPDPIPCGLHEGMGQMNKASINNRLPLIQNPRRHNPGRP